MDPALAQALATIAGALAILILAAANYVNAKAKDIDDEDNSGSL